MIGERKINCDMCGRVDGNLLRTIVEGVELTICQKCSKFGKVLGPLRIQAPKIKPRYAPAPKEEPQEEIIENYSDLIRRKRESLGISQKDFALKLSEKESTMHKIENGNFEPPLSLARKLEKILGIKLVQIVKDEASQIASEKKKTGDGFTLGDFIKVRK